MCVGHSVVPPEDPGGGDVSDHHVDAVVFMSDEDAEDPGGAEQPAEPVIPPHPAWRVLFDEQVGQCTHDRVTTVQEVTTHQVRAGQRQTSSRDQPQNPPDFPRRVVVKLWGTHHVLPRHRQGGDVHGDTAIHVESPDHEETATSDDRFVFKEDPLDEPESNQDQPVDLRDGERPRHSVDIVEELVRQWRTHRLIRHPFMDDCDDNSCKDEVEHGVKESHACFPPLSREAVGALLRHADLDVIAVLPESTAERLDQQAAQFVALLLLFSIMGVAGFRWLGRRGGVSWRVTV